MTKRVTKSTAEVHAPHKKKTVLEDSGHTLKVLTGKTLSKEQIGICAQLLKDGGAVSTKKARENLPNAHCVVLVYKDEEIVGVGAIKAARPDYSLKIKRKSEHPFDLKMAELGYIVVKDGEQGKGLAGRIVRKLLEKYPNQLFATTSKKRMKSTLAHNGFAKCGKSWLGKKKKDKNGHEKIKRALLSLWIKPAE